MTPIDYLLEKPRLHSQVWLIRYCYPQNIPRTFATTVNELGCRPVDGVIPSQFARRASAYANHQEHQGGPGRCDARDSATTSWRSWCSWCSWWLKDAPAAQDGPDGL